MRRWKNARGGTRFISKGEYKWEKINHAIRDIFKCGYFNILHRNINSEDNLREAFRFRSTPLDDRLPSQRHVDLKWLRIKKEFIA